MPVPVDEMWIPLERDWGDIEEIVCNASVDIAEYCWINHIDMDEI